MAATKSAAKSRPKRRKAVRKDENIHIRVTTEQKTMLSAAAERDGQGLSSWMLLMSLRAARDADGGGRG